MNKVQQQREWDDAIRRCRLSDEAARMARELGFAPRSLIKNIPSPQQPWKAPVEEWVRELYAKRERKRLQKAKRWAKPAARQLRPGVGEREQRDGGTTAGGAPTSQDRVGTRSGGSRRCLVGPIARRQVGVGPALDSGAMPYTHTNAEGQTYYLHGRGVTLQNGRRQRIYYFAREPKRGEALDAIPAGYRTEEKPHTGLPCLKLAQRSGA